jgi:hypothetical protein
MEQGLTACHTNALQPILPGIQKIHHIVHREIRETIRIQDKLFIVTVGTPEITGSEKNGRRDDSGIIPRGKLL